MKRYEEYRESDIYWLGKIPKDWNVESLKNILIERNEKNYPIKSKERLSLSIEKGVTLYADKTTNLDRFKDDFTQYKLAHKGDLVLNSMNMIVGAVGVSNYFGCVSPVYYTYYGDINSSKFYEYLFRCKTLQGVLYSLGKGLMAIDRGDGKYNTLRLKVSRDDLRSLKLPLPSTEEQIQIVSYLDDKTAKIDQTIAIRQKEIELLKERRQILIQQAVTKGLDGAVPMKTSGVEWIGQIPEHWEVRKLKYLGSMFSGLTNKKGDDFSKEPKEGFSPFIPFTNIFRNNKISENELHFVKSDPYDVQNVVEFNDILFLMSSETFDDIGKNSIYLGKTKVFLNSFCKGFKVSDKNISPLYINFLLLSKNYREYFASVGRGFTRINIKQEYVLDMPILYLPLHEQVQITTHLEEIEAIITKAIALKEQEIEKLKEYKTVLIDNVVTGKVKINL
ncbi:type I restriction-modification system, specificity subunit S [Myroides odoratimimus]|uniref:restriction endonuclease subunit S n=1 Tax=Myroides odoratimimus TaxID=76832 RepID=UPI00072C0876|nr:restriction endonuclease subunit S [Myroides odoratimimus]GAQ15949.1 type I restriction-modification system, specificity subunit S [Myroides odoratimimus]STZ47791.1 Type I restriction enzyme EcoKI specificity protein [Myroides odoratimimus]